MVRPADSTGAAAATAQVRFDIDTVITRAARVSAEVPGGRPWRVQSPTTSRRHNRLSSPSQGMSSWACMRCTSLFSLSVLACRAGHAFYCVRDGSLDGVQRSDELPSVLFLQWHDYQSSTLRRLPLPHNRRDCPEARRTRAEATVARWQEGVRLRPRQEGKFGGVCRGRVIGLDVRDPRVRLILLSGCCRGTTLPTYYLSCEPVKALHTSTMYN